MDIFNQTPSKKLHGFIIIKHDLQDDDCLSKDNSIKSETLNDDNAVAGTSAINTSCTDISNLKNPTKKVKTKTSLSCDICGTIFSYKSNLIRHMKTHDNNVSVKCKFCDKIFSHRNFLKQHKQQDHQNIEIKTIKCELCEKTFSRKRLLTQHKQEHKLMRKPKQFSCPICDRKFEFQIALDEHELSHINEKRYKCRICVKTFSKANICAKHESLHLAAVNEKCTLVCVFNACRRTFETETDLQVHLKDIHDRTRCDICGILCRKIIRHKRKRHHEVTKMAV